MNQFIVEFILKYSILYIVTLRWIDVLNKINIMKLLERNQMYDTRYNLSSSDFPNTKNKMLATTRNTFASRTDSKLPQLQRSFSYSNAKNAKQKVSDLD